MLIKIAERNHVAANTVTSLEIERQGRGVTVICSSERSHYFVECDDGKTALQTRDRLVSEINAALAQGKEVAP